MRRITWPVYNLAVVKFPTLKLQQKSDRSTENVNLSRSGSKPKCISINDEHNCSTDEKQTSSTVLKMYIFWDLDPASLMKLIHTTEKDSLSNQYPQKTIHQPRTDYYALFLSLQPVDSKKKDCASALHSFRKIIYRTDEWTKQLLRFKSWVFSGSPEQWTETQFLFELFFYLGVALCFSCLMSTVCRCNVFSNF